MNEIITARDPEIIAAEINTIKNEVRQVAILGSIKIGEKLMEAKALVNHGEWGKWLEQNVEYSQSTADYLMRLYQEYGSGQENLFDTWTNSQTFAKLTYSQHIALLALPFGERQEFAEQNHVEDMSTRQLQQAIKERDEAIQSQKEAEEAAEEFNAQLRQANAAKDQANAEKERAQKDKSKAEKSEQNALSLVKKLEKQLADAKAAEKAAVDELKKAQENPTVPESIMEQMRAEVAADAAKEATAGLEKQLEAARKEAEEANRAREAAEAAALEAEAKILAAKKETRLSNPKVVVFRTLFDQTRQNVEKLAQAYKEVAEADPDAAKNCRNAYNALLDHMDTALD